GWSGMQGAWASGGSGGSTYGSATDYNIDYGSGGGGSGGGGGGWYYGADGQSGGRGGGCVALISSGNMTVSGAIYANGGNAENSNGASNGGGESTDGDFDCSCDGYNGCSICPQSWYTASGGAGGGAGGGSGGGIKLMAEGTMNVTGTLQARGGNGGCAGEPDPDNGSCFDFPKGGAGGGGGRIKIIYSSCLGGHSISPSVDRSGGSGGSGYYNGNAGGSGSYNTLTLPVTTITTNPVGLQITVDGVSYTAPAQFCWLPGTSHQISTSSPQYSGMDRYIWSTWSDGGAITHNITSISSGTTTITANFNHEYHLVFEAYTTVGTPLSAGNSATLTLDGSPHAVWDGSPYSVWVAGGSSHLYNFSSTSTGSGATHRWYCAAPPSGSISFGDTIRAYYAEQWWFDIDENGHSSPCAGREGWYNHGTTTYGCVDDSIVTVGSIRYVFSHWDIDASGTRSSQSNNVTMTAARTARANWDAEYLVTFRANTVTSGTDLSAGNYAVVNVDGSPHNIWDGNDYTVYFAVGTSHPYSYTWTSSGSGATHRWFCPAPPSGTVTVATTITGDYHEQWWFDIDENGHSSPCGGLEGWHDHGSIIYGCVSDSVLVAGGTRYVFDHWSVDASGTRSSHSNNITVNAAQTAMANWRTEYWLDVDYAGCGAATPAQTGAGWYPSGTNAPITTEHPVWIGAIRYDFTDWTGGTFGDAFNPITTILMDMPRTATANYILAEVDIIVQTDGTADSVIVDGTEYLSPWSGVWVTGSSHDISTDSIQPGGAGIRYIFDGWADGIAARARTVAPETDSTFTANFTTQYYLTVDNGGHGVAAGEGWFDAGTVTSFSVSSPADETTRDRYWFDYWTGVGTGSYTGTNNPGFCTMNSPITETGNWLRQFRITIDDGGYGSATPASGDLWLFEDSSQTAHITSPDIVSHMYCTGWTGTGSVPASGSDTVVTWTVTDSGTVAWNWAPQPMLVVISEYPGVVPAGTTYYDPGTHIIATCPGETLDIAPGHIAIRLGWTATGSAPASGDSGAVEFDITENTVITWQWRTEFKLTISNPGGHDSPDPPPGDYWCVRDTYIVAWVMSPDGSWYCTGYNGTGSVPAYSPSTFAYFPMTEPSTLTWQWYDYTSVASLTITSVTDSVWPGTGTFYYFLGSTVVCSTYHDTVFHNWRDDLRYTLDGWTGSGDCPATGDSGHVSFIIDETSTLNWQWTQQNRVDVSSESSLGSPVPPEGQHWFDDDSTVDFFVSSPDAGFWCIGYDGTGSIPDGILDSFTTVIDTPSSVNWLWSDEISLLIVHCDYGTPWPPAGTTYFETGTAVTCTVNAIVPIGTGRRMVCTGWTATGMVIPPTGDTNYVSWNINGETHVYWEFKEQLELDVTSGHGFPVPPEGITWHDSSSNIDCSVTSPDGDWYCWGWNGTGSAPSGYGTYFDFDIHDPSTVDWQWVYSTGPICTLFVFSPYGYPVPAGTLVVPAGTHIVATVDDSVFDGGWQYCTGWVGTNSVPALGDSCIVEFDLNFTSELTWIWNGELRWAVVVESESGYGSPRPSVGVHWVPDDTVMTFIVTSPDGMFICVGWNGTGSIPGFGLDTMFTATITTNSSVTWLWEELSGVVTLTVTSDFGTPYPHRGVTYHPIGRHIAASIEDTIFDGDGIRRLCAGWRGGGSSPTTGDSSHFEFDIDVNSFIDWQWVNSYHIDLDYSGCPVAPLQTGEGWYTQGEDANIYTDSVVFDGSDYYMFVNWTDGPVLPDTFRCGFTVDSTYDIVANYVGAARIDIFKNPIHSEGYIEVDGHRYYGVSALTVWWELGSSHTIAVSSVDSTATLRYHFDNWTDGGAISHTVGPVTDDMTLIANYNREYLIRLEKNPPEDTYGVIGFEHTPYYDWCAEDWFFEGETVVIFASDSDMTPSAFDMWTFQNWSDFGERTHVITVTGADTLTAYYHGEHLISIRKSPLE
ncbi:hypothetical protein DRQ36_09640, partial [bacterium]